MEHSSIDWIEIPAKNFSRAIAFYENVFGAAFSIHQLSDTKHALFIDGKFSKKLLNGTIVEIKETEQIGVGPSLFFSATGNFELFAERIEKNGGKIIVRKTLMKSQTVDGQQSIQKTFIDNQTGYFSYFLDSEGNKMGLYGSS